MNQSKPDFTQTMEALRRLEWKTRNPVVSMRPNDKESDPDATTRAYAAELLTTGITQGFQSLVEFGNQIGSTNVAKSARAGFLVRPMIGLIPRGHINEIADYMTNPTQNDNATFLAMMREHQAHRGEPATTKITWHQEMDDVVTAGTYREIMKAQEMLIQAAYLCATPSCEEPGATAGLMEANDYGFINLRNPPADQWEYDDTDDEDEENVTEEDFIKQLEFEYARTALMLRIQAGNTINALAETEPTPAAALAARLQLLDRTESASNARKMAESADLLKKALELMECGDAAERTSRLAEATEACHTMAETRDNIVTTPGPTTLETAAYQAAYSLHAAGWHEEAGLVADLNARSAIRNRYSMRFLEQAADGVPKNAEYIKRVEANIFDMMTSELRHQNRHNLIKLVRPEGILE